MIRAASAGNRKYLTLLGAEPVTYGDGLAERVRALSPDGADVAPTWPATAFSPN